MCCNVQQISFKPHAIDSNLQLFADFIPAQI